MVGPVTTTPHDALFKAAFSKLRHARGLLRALVPGALGRRIAWSTLRLESGIAVGDEDLDEQRMDLVLLGAGRQAARARSTSSRSTRARSTRGWHSACSVTSWRSGRATAPSTRARGSSRRFSPSSCTTAPPAGPRRSPSRSMLDADAELLAAFGPHVPAVPVPARRPVRADRRGPAGADHDDGRRAGGALVAEARPGPGGGAHPRARAGRARAGGTGCARERLALHSGDEPGRTGHPARAARPPGGPGGRGGDR